jgi:CheY-like chemotaxis protein
VNAEQKTVLIVDDSVTNLHVLNQILKPHYRVKATRSGVKAVDIATRDRPDAVVLDLMMPDLDGMEVCRRIKAVPELERIPVFFVTGSVEQAAHAECKDAGAAGVLTKPVDGRALIAALTEGISTAQGLS